jgi:hypothetical protein
VLPGTRVPDLVVGLEHFLRRVSPNIAHDEIVDIGLPEQSGSGDLFSFLYLDAMASQNGSARLAGCLAAVDEENPADWSR